MTQSRMNLSEIMRKFWEKYPNGTHEKAVAYARKKPGFKTIADDVLKRASYNQLSLMKLNGALTQAKRAKTMARNDNPSNGTQLQEETIFMRKWHVINPEGMHDHCVAGAKVAGFKGTIGRSYQSKAWVRDATPSALEELESGVSPDVTNGEPLVDGQMRLAEADVAVNGDRPVDELLADAATHIQQAIAIRAAATTLADHAEVTQECQWAAAAIKAMEARYEQSLITA